MWIDFLQIRYFFIAEMGTASCKNWTKQGIYCNVIASAPKITGQTKKPYFHPWVPRKGVPLKMKKKSSALWLLHSQPWSTVEVAASLTRCSLLHLPYFNPKVTGSIIIRLGPKAWQSTYRGFESETFQF